MPVLDQSVARQVTLLLSNILTPFCIRSTISVFALGIMHYIVMYNCHSYTILHHITFSGSSTKKAHFKKITNVTEQEMYMSYKQLQHTSIITDSESAYTFLITCYQINAHCVVQIVTKVRGGSRIFS